MKTAAVLVLIALIAFASFLAGGIWGRGFATGFASRLGALTGDSVTATTVQAVDVQNTQHATARAQLRPLVEALSLVTTECEKLQVGFSRGMTPNEFRQRVAAVDDRIVECCSSITNLGAGSQLNEEQRVMLMAIADKLTSVRESYPRIQEHWGDLAQAEYHAVRYEQGRAYSEKPEEQAAYYGSFAADYRSKMEREFRANDACLANVRSLLSQLLTE
jgi:hypothetical protein